MNQYMNACNFNQKRFMNIVRVPSTKVVNSSCNCLSYISCDLCCESSTGL